jgi:hypothetical protein
VNSTPTPKEGDAQKAADAQVGRPDERLAHAYEEIKRADEQLTEMSERLAKIEGDTPRPAAAAPAPPSQPAPSPDAEPPPAQASAAQVAPAQMPPPQVSPAKPASRSPVALLMAAGFVVTALVLSAYGGGIVTRWAPQLGSKPSSPPEGPTLAAKSAPALVQVASAETAPLPVTPQAASTQPTPSQATSLAQAQTGPQEAAPPAATAPAPTPPAVAAPAAAALPDQAQLLQKIARDLATLERNIEQLRATQQQMAADNSKAIGELKASQEEMKRTLAKAPEQPLPPRVSPPAKPPVSVVRRPERTYQPLPPVRARPRYYPREQWYYDDW